MGEHKFKTKRSRPGRGSRFSTTLIVVLVVVAAVGAFNLFRKSPQDALSELIPERSKGNPQASLRIVEFIDFQCNHCRHGAGILKEYLSRHPQEMVLTMRYFPLGQLNSSMSAYYAQCAARQGKFWEMHDQLLATQDQWRPMLKVQDYFNRLAQPLGLDVQALQACSQEPAVHAQVASDRALGDSQQVRSTPTYFINGKMHVGPKELEQALKAHFGNE